MSTAYVELKNIKTYFPLYEGILFRKVKGIVRAVDDVSLSIEKGSIVGLVGESGCGKSTLGRSIIRLVDLTGGSVMFDSVDISKMPFSKLMPFRSRFQMIFQDPYASLNPRMTVFDTLAEPLLTHSIVKRSGLIAEISSLMNEVGLAPRFMKKYPHEFSGGQRQRIAVARALAVRPEFIVADEPVSALDVSIQSQVLNLLMNLCTKRNLTMLFISHDLSVIRHITSKTAVMYLGKIIEYGMTEELFQKPRHPYTKALLSAIPKPDPDNEKNRNRIILEGDPPSLINLPGGCRFHPRCPYAKPRCSQTEPQLEIIGDTGHIASCLRLKEIE
ncbi:MAG: ABC transporter ATP-binding protein [Chitinivibrionales bacterium]|nr:ABC transporter ATP-binding protein [Chitinivibrionales bacterium]